MNTETVKLSQIQLNSSNPRTISKESMDKLVTSILVLPKMLTLRPIVVDDTMTALGGNMRFRALTAIAQMDVVEIGKRLNNSRDFHKKTEAEQQSLLDYWGAWLDNPTAPISRADELTADEQREFIIKDNVGFGAWDMDALANDWDNADLSEWGVPIDWEDSNKEEADEDDMSEKEMDDAPSRTKLGDIWQLGNHRLMCGDSTSPEQIAALMNGEQADMWLTDPPYNVNYEGATEDKLKIINDSMSAEDFHEFLVKAYTAADASMKAGASFYIWHADREGYNFRSAAAKMGWTIRQCLIWNKNSMVPGRLDYQWKHEPCLYGWKGGASHNWYGDRKQTTVIDFDRPTRNGEHPTMKPVGLFGYLINNSSKRGDRILDSFGGSGTTIIACEELGRIGYSMELDPHYCDVIIARWEKLTGEKAVCIENYQT